MDTTIAERWLQALKTEAGPDYRVLLTAEDIDTIIRKNPFAPEDRPPFMRYLVHTNEQVVEFTESNEAVEWTARALDVLLGEITDFGRRVTARERRTPDFHALVDASGADDTEKGAALAFLALTPYARWKLVDDVLAFVKDDLERALLDFSARVHGGQVAERFFKRAYERYTAAITAWNTRRI